MYEGRATPKKVYTVPKGAQLIRLEMDFYEIDFWAGCTPGFGGPDKLGMVINEERIDIGCFFRAEDEKNREGRTAKGMQWVMYSLEPPEHMCCQEAAVDQKHKIIVFIPPSFYKRQGKVHVTLIPKLTRETGLNKAAGFDNISVIAQSCRSAKINAPTPKSSQITSNVPPGGCLRYAKKVISYENFENKRSSGWKNGKISYSKRLSLFLGRYGNRKSPSKVFRVSKTYQSVEVRFDFYEIDLWDGERQNGGGDSLKVYINGIRIDFGK
mmetsp:Transcript_12273/g.17640  ORF Transcript_12273/g.17640 Transcript_12273/m.17640 type:complete len:268 (+) Transcript_12273:309-1112(+)